MAKKGGKKRGKRTNRVKPKRTHYKQRVVRSGLPGKNTRVVKVGNATVRIVLMKRKKS